MLPPFITDRDPAAGRGRSASGKSSIDSRLELPLDVYPSRPGA